MRRPNGIKDSAELKLLDAIAEATALGKVDFNSIQALHSGCPELQVPEEFMSFSPVCSPERVGFRLRG